MRSGDNNCKYFPKNKLTKLTNLVQFKRMLINVLSWGLGEGLDYATGAAVYDVDVCV